MKSIKEYPYSSSNYSLQNALSQSLWYARCCILSVALMSGFGIPWNFDNTRVDKWFDILNSESIKKNILPENVTLLRAIYKKGNPNHINPYNGNSRDYKNFNWDDSSFKKTITPESQAYLIINEIMLAKFFYRCIDDNFDNEDNISEKMGISMLLINSAEIQAHFMSDYMRNCDGLFISKNDVSQNPFGEPQLEEIDEVPNVTCQSLSMKAFSMLSDVLSNPSYKFFRNDEFAVECKKYSEEIYEVLKNSPDDVFNGKTKDLCSTISSCIQYYKSYPDKDEVLDYITKLSIELESRIDLSGNVMRFSEENKLTSSSSCFQIIKTLIESYRITNIYKFVDSPMLIYKKLNLSWDSANGLYCLNGNNKYKYTLRDIGLAISGLNAIRLFAENDYRIDASNKLSIFFNNAINTSKIVCSCMPPPPQQDYENFFNCTRNCSGTIEYNDFCYHDIPQSLEIGMAPVFAKKFTFKPKKNKYDVNNDCFYSDYAMFTTYELFCMNYPYVECFYDKDVCHKAKDNISILPNDGTPENSL